MIQLDEHIRALEAEFKSLLNTRSLGRSLRFLQTVDSTNSEAMRWADEGAPEGSLVFSESQSTGRGRHGRHWEAAPSANLLFSLVLRPTLPPHNLGLITIAASIAMASAIDKFTEPTASTIKWPNDILIDGKKCCGMLLESAISGSSSKTQVALILGIGLNVNQEQFSDGIASNTTSLLLETGRHIPRMALLSHFLDVFENRYANLETEPRSNLRNAYQARLEYLGQRTVLHFSGRDEFVEGEIEGISNTGALKLRTKNGLEEFHAGEVSSRPQIAGD